MRLSDTLDVQGLLGAAALPENSDIAIQTLLARLLQAMERWPKETILQFCDEVADGTSLADPYRAGLVAWACGCLEEIGHSTPRSQVAVLSWAERTIELAVALRDRVCESLPGGILSTAEEFEQRRSELAAVIPQEHRAWEALAKWYVAATTVLVRHPGLRLRVRHLYDKTRKLARYLPNAMHIANAIRIPHEEAFLILEPSRGRGVVATVSDIDSMMHLLPALAHTFATAFAEPALEPSESIRRAALDHEPPALNPSDVFRTHWTTFHWTAAREDGALPVMNEDPIQVVYGRTRLYAEDKPWDARPFAGLRVVLLQPAPFELLLATSRSYSQLRPRVEVTSVLGPDEVQQWMQRFAWVNKLNARGGLQSAEPEGDLFFDVCEGLSLDLPGRWHDALLVRALRRLVPLAREHWAPLPFELLEKLLRVLNALERSAASNDAGEAELTLALAKEVSDIATRADESGLASTIAMNLAEGARLLCEQLLRPNLAAGFGPLALRLVGHAWQEAVMLARMAGYQPDPGEMKRTLLEDRKQLAAAAKAAGAAPACGQRAVIGNLWLAGRPAWWPLLPEYPAAGRDYEIALSFAGRDREHARKLASALVRRGCRVFFDERERAGLAGRELPPLLRSVFRDRALFCVVFISEPYVAGAWTRMEWRAIMERMTAEGDDYLLPARLDDAAIEGLPDTVAYLDLRKLGDEEFHEAVVARVTARLSTELAEVQTK